MEKLPDFDYMNELADIAGQTKAEIKMLERLEEMLAAMFMRTAIENDKFWLGGKPPTATVHLAKIIAKIGNTVDDQIQMEELRDRIAEAYGKFIQVTGRLQTCRDMISVYQTESANKRVTLT